MPQIVTTVSISASGKYSYSPNSVNVTKPNTTLVYQLDSASAAIWQIVGLTDTDTKNQLSGESKSSSGDSISILDANTVAETFSITVVAQHRTDRKQLIGVDPTVVNFPD
jgi:hypothetical protein